MPLMEWNEKLSVGITQFDNEHKVLVGMVNDLFDGLINYTKTHFANEERFMTLHKYPNFEAHKAEHDALAKQVLDVQAKYKSGASAALSMEVMNFLKNWLVKHIMGTDKTYGPFLNSKGVK